MDNPKPGEAPNVENMKVSIQPKKGCRKCHGLGRIGFVNGDQNDPLVCSCVIKIYTDMQKQMKATKAAAAAAAKDEKAIPPVVQPEVVAQPSVPETETKA